MKTIKHLIYAYFLAGYDIQRTCHVCIASLKIYFMNPADNNMKTNDIPDCWDAENCSDDVRNSCPAYPDKGKECWKITMTQCGNGKIEKMSLLEKIIYCRNECKFYRKYLIGFYP